MLKRVIRFFWPDLTDVEIKKYGMLSMAFFFVIGAYWLERPLKDGIFFGMVGSKWQPSAKIISVFVILFLVMIYSKLIDMFEKQNLFYIFGSVYIILFAFIGYFIWQAPHVPADAMPSFYKGVAWVNYFVIESFGSLIVALFWSFTNSISDASTAKRCYPLVLAGAQFGSILGPTLALFAKQTGMLALFMVIIGALIGLMLVINKFMKTIPQDQIVISKLEAKSEAKPKTGFMEGAKLLFTRPYLFGIFMVVTIYEVVGTIVDYQMKVQAQAFYTDKEALTSFLGIFGIAANGLAFFMALLGVAYIMKRFGLRFCLLTFPIVLGSAVAILYGINVFELAGPWMLLWFTFAVMMIAKGLSYALNNPAKEMMYIPTSKDAKFKTKGWIDMFGSRVSKAGGSAFNEGLKASPALLMSMGTLLSLGLIGVWIVAAVFVSGKFNQLTKENKIVE